MVILGHLQPHLRKLGRTTFSLLPPVELHVYTTSAFILFTAKNYTLYNIFVACSWFSPPCYAQSELVRLDSSDLRSTGSNTWCPPHMERVGAVRLGLLIIHRQLVIQL